MSGERGARTSQPEAEERFDLAPVEPVLRSPQAICRWELDVAMPAEHSREIAVGFCGALLRRLGKAVDEIVVEDQLAVFALPRIPVPAGGGEAAAVGLLVPRSPSARSSRALRAAIRSICQEGFRVAGRDLRLRSADPNAYDARRWVGPSRIWTSVTPWVSEGVDLEKLASRRQRHLLDALGASLLGNLDPAQRILAMEELVASVQAHDEAWVPGFPPAGGSFGVRSSCQTHVRICFRGPVEGPIAIGRDRLLGMGLLAPVALPIQPFE